jgi:hypothetical protein
MHLVTGGILWLKSRKVKVLEGAHTPLTARLSEQD